MRFDLTTPCKNCPFRNDSTRITFQCRERAEEIEEQAFRRGFPCHLSAELEEDDESFRAEGFHATEKSQMCAGFIAMQLKAQDVAPSFQDNEDGLDAEEMFDKVETQYGDFWNLPVFESAEDFFKANEKEN